MTTEEGRPFHNTVVTKPVEFINYDCEISEEFNAYLKRWKFDKYNFKYNVLSILGCQSSGKSSLLNSVFGLEFDVMNTKLGHSQTTKGLWGTLITPNDGTDSNATIVIDVEGTDSRERGEGRLTFEHRSSLLCLAISDCVIINLWYHSLGNLTGSNYGLLKTVMEANLELAEGSGGPGGQGSSKTIICFCIRDWFPELAPLDTVREKVVNGYMMDIWKEIKKPAKFKNIDMEDLFHIELFGFNHALVKKEEFAADAEKFRETWNDTIKPKTYSRQVPSDGFFYYAKNILNTVKEQSHLDIPTQREMLANIRCQEIKNSVLESALPKIQALVGEVQEREVEDLNVRIEALINVVLEDYNESASRYEKGTAVKIGVELIRTLLQRLQPAFEANVSQYCKELMLRASLRMQEKLALNGRGKTLMIGSSKAVEVWPKFTQICEEIRKELLDLLSAKTAGYDVKYANEEGMTVEFEFDKTVCTDMFNVTFKNERDMFKTRHLQALKGEIEGLIKNGFKVIDDSLLARDITSKKYWGDVSELLNKAYNSSLDTYKTCYEGMIADVKKNEFEYFSFMVLLEATKHNLERIEGNVTEIVVNRFEAFFNYQEFNGEPVPREWEKVTDDFLKQTYTQCKKEALNIIAVLRDCKPPSIKMPAFDVTQMKADHILYRDFSTGMSEFSETTSLLSSDALVDIVKACRKRFQEIYMNAQKIQSSSNSGVSWKNVPPAFWVALLICGWNEMIAIIRIIFKVQLLIPLLIVALFVVQYFSTTVFGERARQFIDPIKYKGMSIACSVSQWAVKTALTKMADVKASSNTGDPPGEDDKNK
ncbi:hypothetical protein BgAZ_300560 [Babesia gibsoni]|uniref:Protein SEY1 homolog n=1 Tax=Babesia gibsoni TaxID=33632 RepID=A0AAD8LN89_BABGI|nr:hypothetical protein BgAZ_300560 [Babesia gibsoni]